MWGWGWTNFAFLGTNEAEGSSDHSIRENEMCTVRIKNRARYWITRK